MTREQLQHAIRAACDVAGDTELLIVGSQAILGEYPDAPPSLRGSIEVDVQPVNKPQAIDAIDGALGELSPFHRAFGFYVHGLSIDAVTLPEGWRARTVEVCDAIGTRGHVGRCLETHDLAASKLAAYREKDRAFVRTLLAEGLVDPEVLMDRVAALDVDSATRARLQQWVEVTAADLRA